MAHVADITEFRDELSLDAVQGAPAFSTERYAETIHDLRNMLTIITSGLHVLGRRAADPELSGVLEAMQHAALTAGQMAVRLSTQTIGGDRGLVNVAETLARLATLIRPGLSESVTFSVRLWPRIPRFCADPIEFESALLNLVTNALMAMPTGGRLMVDVRFSRGRLLIAVADTGIGMDEITRASAGTAFFTTRSGGTGLGVHQVRRFVRSLGGRILIRSKPGKGTLVILSIPVESGQHRKDQSTDGPLPPVVRDRSRNGKPRPSVSSDTAERPLRLMTSA